MSNSLTADICHIQYIAGDTKPIGGCHFRDPTTFEGAWFCVMPDWGEPAIIEAAAGDISADASQLTVLLPEATTASVPPGEYVYDMGVCDEDGRCTTQRGCFTLLPSSLSEKVAVVLTCSYSATHFSTQIATITAICLGVETDVPLVNGDLTNSGTYGQFLDQLNSFLAANGGGTAAINVYPSPTNPAVNQVDILITDSECEFVEVRSLGGPPTPFEAIC